MSAQVIHIEARRFKPMSCPDHETLVLIAEGSEDQEDSTRAHLDLCSSCSAQVADLRAELQEWRATGIVEEERFDDSYFANLANDVEKAITAASTPPERLLRDQRIVALVAHAALPRCGPRCLSPARRVCSPGARTNPRVGRSTGHRGLAGSDGEGDRSKPAHRSGTRGRLRRPSDLPGYLEA